MLDSVLVGYSLLSYPLTSYSVHRDDKGKACLVVPSLVPSNDNAGTPCSAKMLMVYIALDKVNVVPIGKEKKIDSSGPLSIPDTTPLM